MNEGRLNRHAKHTSITTILGVVVMLLLLSVSCGGDKKEVVAVEFDPETTYTMRTTEIVSLISDSGITRFRMTSPEWMVFEKASEPYWYFPQGHYVEQFDSLFNTEASLTADTAYYWPNKGFWKGIGNVVAENFEGDRFETDTLYWDRTNQLIYSDAFMRITTPDRILTGVGFESNQNMTDYRIFHPQGSFPINEEQNDTTSQAQPADATPQPVEMPHIQRQRPQRRQPPVDTMMPDSMQVIIEDIPEPIPEDLPEEINPIENEMDVIENEEEPGN